MEVRGVFRIVVCVALCCCDPVRCFLCVCWCGRGGGMCRAQWVWRVPLRLQVLWLLCVVYFLVSICVAGIVVVRAVVFDVGMRA